MLNAYKPKCDFDLFYMHLFYFRKIEKMDCEWHRVYYGIFNAVQSQVKNAFGQNVTLDIKESFDCKKCINIL